LVLQVDPHSAFIQILPGKYIPTVFGLFEGANELQMTHKRAFWKAYFLRFKRVGRAGNYPTWIILHKLEKTEFMTECLPGQN